jgi:hypothetical protein
MCIFLLALIKMRKLAKEEDIHFLVLEMHFIPENEYLHQPIMVKKAIQ